MSQEKKKLFCYQGAKSVLSVMLNSKLNKYSILIISDKCNNFILQCDVYHTKKYLSCFIRFLFVCV